ncbi:hypothetical protein BOX15_Mlig033682g1, partial [Macrostomum lignano]
QTMQATVESEQAGCATSSGSDEQDCQDDYDDDFDDIDDAELARISGLADSLDRLCVSASSGQQPQAKLLDQHQRLVDLSDRFVKPDRRTRDKADRATTDNCLDQRSLRVMFKLLQQGVLTNIEGCISAGKEANVYYAISPEYGHLAIKVYMTSVMPFKNRDKYMTGDRRLRHGVGKRSWKKVSKWAEKEFRNLLRVAQAGIPAPKPIKLKGVVLLMTLIGEEADAAPKLKDVDSDDAELWHSLYWQVVGNLRTLYQQCRLVHGDLSEYNLLYNAGQVIWIDFSQSVEHEHPQTFAFLRADCRNVNAFFSRKPVRILSDQELFEFITDPTITAENCERCLAALQDVANGREQPPDVDGAFQGVHIPRRLEEVLHYERNALLLRQGKLTQHDLLFATVSGMSHDLKGPKRTAGLLSDSGDGDANDESAVRSENNPPADDEVEHATASESGSSVTSSADEAEEDDGANRPSGQQQKRPPNETTEERKARKQALKAERREKQKSKVPKHEKKRQTKAKKK